MIIIPLHKPDKSHSRDYETFSLGQGYMRWLASRTWATEYIHSFKKTVEKLSQNN